VARVRPIQARHEVHGQSPSCDQFMHASLKNSKSCRNGVLGNHGRSLQTGFRWPRMPSSSNQGRLDTRKQLIYHLYLCCHRDNSLCTAALRRGLRSLTKKPPGNGLKPLHNRFLRVSPLFRWDLMGSLQLSPLFHRITGRWWYPIGGW